MFFHSFNLLFLSSNSASKLDPVKNLKNIENLIELKNVSKKFKDKSEEIIILDKISIKLPANKLVALTGPSGSGKSTLIHLFALLDTPEQGEYNILTSVIYSLMMKNKVKL